MRKESEIKEMLDRLYDYHDLCNKNDDDRWQCDTIKEQIGTLEWALGEQEAEDVFGIE